MHICIYIRPNSHFEIKKKKKTTAAAAQAAAPICRRSNGAKLRNGVIYLLIAERCLNQKSSKKLHKNLQVSKKSSTFAAEKENGHENFRYDTTLFSRWRGADVE